MPKKAIKEAMREVRDVLAENRYKGIWVPTADSLSCQWAQPKNRKKTGTWIPWEILTEVLEFALDNAFIRMPNGKIYWQKDGIPMGDPLSPAMTIGTCAWMERKWAAGLDPEWKNKYRGARYMDDVLLVTSRSKESISIFKSVTTTVA